MVNEIDANHLFESIRAWATVRGLDKTDSHAQMTKLTEELGEVANALIKKKPKDLEDGIGDAVVVLTILALQNGLRIEDCVATAMNEIKDRKGKLVNGTFVKETDL